MNCYGSLYTNLSYRIIFLTGGRTGSAAVCRNIAGIWTTKKSALGNNKEVFDAELWGIHLALQLASGSYIGYKEITIFSDS